MAVNLDKPHLWKQDIAQSVDLYNQWFLKFAPQTYRQERSKAATNVAAMLERTNDLQRFTAGELRTHPDMLFALRMATAPPIARDRLVGLAGVSKALVNSMEKNARIPPKMASDRVSRDLQSIVKMIRRLFDVDILTWLTEKREATDEERLRAATIVADRLCGANADPIVRNAQEQRQLAKISKWLKRRKYKDASGKTSFNKLQPGDFAFRLNVSGLKDDGESVNIPVDAVVLPQNAATGQLPILIEAKSAGDFTNVNKRRKEEATKVAQLRRKHGKGVQYLLFLCGYFDSGYLGYEAAEGIDWVWEHRMDDLAAFGI